MKPCYRCGREGITMIVMHKECYDDRIRKIADGNEQARKVEALKKKLEVEHERENT